MGQGNSANSKQPVQKSDSAEQVEQVEQNEDDDVSSKLGSLKKNKWLPRKQSEDKPKKPKKNDKKKKKKEEQEEVSSATCITEADRSSLRHSRIELHLEECQPAPDEDDAISLSSCGEDPRKNLKDIENEEPPSLLICDTSSSSMTASPGESLSSGQDSGFARGNTILSVSSEEEHTEKNDKNKENTSEIGTKLISATVEVTEKCKDYIEKSIPFNSISPISNPENSIAEEQTKKSTDDSLAESNSKQENTGDTISTSTVPSFKLETQSSITETPEIASHTEENSVVEDQIKSTDDSPALSNLGQENICDTISTSTVPSPKLETQSSLTETPEIASQIGESLVVEAQTKEDTVDSHTESNLVQENTCDIISTSTIPSPKLETQSSLTETLEISSQTEENSVVEAQTKKDEVDNSTESNLGQEDTSNTISTSTISSPKLETQRSITETPEIASQTKVIKDSDLVMGMVKELVNETLESAVENLTHEYKRLNNKSELDEVNQLESVPQDNKVEEAVDKELNLTEVTEAAGLEEKSNVNNESHIILSDVPQPEPFQDKVSGEGIDNKDTAALKGDVIVTNEEVTESLNQELEVEDISVAAVCSTDSVNVDNTEIIEKSGDFEELSYSLKVKPVCLLESLTEEPEDKSEKDTTEVEIERDEIETLKNCDSIVPDDSLLSNESVRSEDNSIKYEVSESVGFNSQLNEQIISDPEARVETIQKEDERTVCPSEILITTDLDADDSGINNSGESLPPFPLDLSDESMTENSQIIEVTPSFQPSTPEIITVDVFPDNCKDSSSGSAPSPPPTKESKETAEQPSSSTTQPIPDSTTGAVFV